jgi:D-glycero-alpha-D-manno-heptose 1-phosphate guanylyltransferase
MNMSNITHPTTAIVLAGGLGTRLRSVVQDVPKPMASVGGKPFLEIVLGYYRQQGINRFILSVGHLAHIIQDHFGNAWHDCQIDYSVENVPLGTGGGILQASTLLGPSETTCLALNGDTFFAIDLPVLTAFHSEKKASISLSAFTSRDVARYMGMTVDENKRITHLNVKYQSGLCLVNGGAYLINQSLLKALTTQSITTQSWENDTLPGLLMQDQRLYAHAIGAQFIDIGIPDDFSRAQQFDFQPPLGSSL